MSEIQVPHKLWNEWYKAAEGLAKKELVEQVLLENLTVGEVKQFELSELLSAEVKNAIFEPFRSFAKGYRENERKSKKKKEYKQVLVLTPENVSKAALSRHVRPPTDNTSYDLKQRKKAEQEHAKLAEVKKAALALPQKKKDKIKRAFKTNPFKKPLPHNKPRR